MLIITEKPGVAKDFARALGCSYSTKDRFYKDKSGKYIIANCIGHLFSLNEPISYSENFKDWTNLPVIPERFLYHVNKDVKDTAEVVINVLKKHKDDEILIATDADREGEIIARECLNEAGIRNLDNIKRFWVSQALTEEVIKKGISEAKALSCYEKFSAQGFARQHADWLTGINATRYITNFSGCLYPVGRVQTAVLEAINERCRKIDLFSKEKYYEFYGIFKPTRGGKITGCYVDGNRNSKFQNNSNAAKLREAIGKKIIIKNIKREEKTEYPPLLYNLNDLQKDCFRYFGYSAEKTLKIVQKLYEEYKCVSYPRTPSRVMGSGNVELCQKLFMDFADKNPCYSGLKDMCNMDSGNKRIFNDAKLEAHHAIIALASLPQSADEEESNIYHLILGRFMLSSAPPFRYETQTITAEINNDRYIIESRKILEPGWKSFLNFTKKFEKSDSMEFQDISETDLSELILEDVMEEEKYTKPPKHYNEATILSFMENPKGDDPEKKLVGLGTPATRHTFVPKLMKYGYIEIKDKNILITGKGKTMLEILKQSPFKDLTDISQTTQWESSLSENPERFEEKIKDYIKESVCNHCAGNSVLQMSYEIRCPVCGKVLKRGKKGWYCSGYGEGCCFSICNTISGAVLNEKDVKLICEGKKSTVKKCKSKKGIPFTCRFALNGENKVCFMFEYRGEK